MGRLYEVPRPEQTIPKDKHSLFQTYISRTKKNKRTYVAFINQIIKAKIGFIMNDYESEMEDVKRLSKEVDELFERMLSLHDAHKDGYSTEEKHKEEIITLRDSINKSMGAIKSIHDEIKTALLKNK